MKIKKLLSWFNKPKELKTKNNSEIPLSYVDGNTFGTWANKTSNNPYKTVSTIKRAIDLIAYNMAQLPIDVYIGDKKYQPTSDPNRVDITTLLERPNEIVSGFKFKLIHWSYYLLYDKVYWLLDINPFGIIKNFYILNPNMLVCKYDSNGAVLYYIYNNKLKLSPEEVIEFSGFNPSSPISVGGVSILDTIKKEYKTDIASANYQQKFFENGSRVSGVITVDKDTPISRKEMQEVLADWVKAHRGEQNAYKVGALLSGMKYEERGMTMRDAEFIEGRKDIKDRIIEAYGIPKSVYGLVDKIDRATATTQNRQFWQLTLKPLALMLQSDLNTFLFSKYYPDKKAKIDFSNVEELKKDLNETADAATKFFNLGYTRNEINTRFKLGMSEDKSGNERYIPSTLITLDNANAAITTTKDIEGIENIIIVKSKNGNPYKEAYKTEQKKQESLFHSKIKRYLFEYRAEILKALNGNKSIEIDIATILNTLNLIKNKQDIKVTEVFEPLYIDAATKTGKYLYKLLNIERSFKPNTNLISTYTHRIKGINTTLNNKIKKEIAEGVDKGEGINSLVKRIKGVYNFTSSRATVIARTESSVIMSATTHNTYENEGIKKKAWLSTNDSKVRPEHMLNQKQGSIPLDRLFASGERFPGDGSVNCRCTLVPDISS